MTRNVRAKYLEPIGLAEANGKSGLKEKMAFGLFIVKTFLGSFNPWEVRWPVCATLMATKSD
ncbi:MAG: hypothetical protein U0930_08565 [Pirellulales bacterium]